jgi:hypothetical protein
MFIDEAVTALDGVVASRSAKPVNSMLRPA